MLVVPYIHKAPLQLGQVLVAWDGSATAARALGDALPLLAKAKAIQVVSVVDGNAGPTGPRIVRHLEQHAITAKFHSLLGADDPTGALLSYAADCCADLLVMGGYGHSRFRELLLGGTTRGILASMTLPVFMSH
ncbi:MAG: universal stress protein [Gemmatimonadales bacterium]